MTAKIYVTLKPGLLDAQGKTVKGALEALGFKEVKDVRIGKYIELDLQTSSAQNAKASVDKMCQKLLANTIVETYRIELPEGKAKRE